MVPNLSPALSTVPTLGSSTKMTSPSSDWAWSLMPTVATPPSTCTHSWLSLRSGIPFSRGPPVKRQAHPLGRRRGATNVDGHVAVTIEVGSDRCGGHGRPHREPDAAAGDHADLAAALAHRLAMAGDGARAQAEPDEPARWRLAQPAQRGRADEVTLVQLHRPAERGAGGGGGGIHVLAVQPQPRLEAQRVARA